MTEGAKKIGFALLDILGLPIFDAHVASDQKKMPLAPSIQSICERRDWFILTCLVPTLSTLGSGYLVSKPHLQHPKPIV